MYVTVRTLRMLQLVIFFPSTLFFTFVPHPSVSTRNILILVFALMLCIHFPMLVWALVLKLTIVLVRALIYKTRLRLRTVPPNRDVFLQTL